MYKFYNMFPDLFFMQGDKPRQGKSFCRCNPNDIIQTIQLLSDDQKDRIRALGWGRILDIKIDAVRSRKLYTWLLTKIDTINMVIHASAHTTLPINKHVVWTVMGVPPGTKPHPSYSYGEVCAERHRLAEELGCQGGRITLECLKDKLREHKTDELSIRCFFLILFNRLLFSTTSLILTNTEVEYTMDFGNFAEVDWQQAMIEDIREAANQWNSSGKESVNPSLGSCPPLLIVSTFTSKLSHLCCFICFFPYALIHVFTTTDLLP